MGYDIFQNDSRQKQELLDALKKDIESASAEAMVEETTIRLDFNYVLPIRNDVNSLVPGQEQGRGYVCRLESWSSTFFQKYACNS